MIELGKHISWLISPHKDPKKHVIDIQKYADITDPQQLQLKRFEHFFSTLAPGLKNRQEDTTLTDVFQFTARDEAQTPFGILALKVPNWKRKKFYAEAVVLLAAEINEYQPDISGVRFLQIEYGEHGTKATDFLAVKSPGIGIGSALGRTSRYLLQREAYQLGASITHEVEDENSNFYREYRSAFGNCAEPAVLEALETERLRWQSLFPEAKHVFKPSDTGDISEELSHAGIMISSPHQETTFTANIMSQIYNDR